MKTKLHYITGRTFELKQTLDALGCTWDAGRRAWHTGSEEIAAKAQDLVDERDWASIPPRFRTPRRGGPPPVTTPGADPEHQMVAFLRWCQTRLGCQQTFIRYGQERGWSDVLWQWTPEQALEAYAAVWQGTEAEMAAEPDLVNHAGLPGESRKNYMERVTREDWWAARAAEIRARRGETI